MTTDEYQRAKKAEADAADRRLVDRERVFFHATPSADACAHDFGGWRNFADGGGGEQVCSKCGMGAMEYTLRCGP